MINRYELVNRHNPIMKDVNPESPLSVGNGEFAFTVDVTGLQTLYKEQIEHEVPLCTMSQWGWHKTPAKANKYYTMDDLVMTEYESVDRTVTYAVDKIQGNEEVYHWLRENPHRLNLARISFFWEDKEITSDQIKDIRQELNLYEGIINSKFWVEGYSVKVTTVCHQEEDILGIYIESEALLLNKLTVKFLFPYGSPDITASDWEKPNSHHTIVKKQDENSWQLERTLDQDSYHMAIKAETKAELHNTNMHEFTLRALEGFLCFTCSFTKEQSSTKEHTFTKEHSFTKELSFHKEPKEYKEDELTFSKVVKSSITSYRDFWENGAIVDFSGSTDQRANELERRVILSLYLLKIQSCGSIPPQETGLTCNSWYGKFHLEMHLWHSAFLPLWNRSRYLEKSLFWYQEHLPKARENAKRNGYAGARWPKMVACDAIDSPSPIATLLIWQQPHILFMLELLYRDTKREDILREYWNIVKETADFMCDFAKWNEKKKCYDLPAPLIPAQERFNPRTTSNPTFELEYWSFGLKIAASWAKRLGKEKKEWEFVASHMALLPVDDGRYLSHEGCVDTFTHFNEDHPSMLLAYGLLPGERADAQYVRNTYDKIMECWEFDTMWGWDFAFMAMTKVRLGDPSGAIDILLMDTSKNSYVASGNNYQRLRHDLPLYLPGNGSLLLAVAMMVAGYQGCEEETPGFPKDGSWCVRQERMLPFPY
ncbi:glycoside hydrolase family 65 [Lachnoclostridium sp.]|nr:glycoside hydrolase family 65 [Lachnoclostridium sp.]